MKNMLKKIISCIMVFSLVTSFPAALAAPLEKSNEHNQPNIFEYMGTYYYGEDLDDIILNMVSRQDGSIEVNIHYKDIEYSLVQYILQPNEITSEPMGLAPTFWNDLKAVALQTFSEYDIIDSRDFLVASEHIATRAQYDKFRDILEDEYGQEYSNKTIATKNGTPAQKVTEDMEFIIEYKEVIKIGKDISVASFITTYISAAVSLPLVASICMAVGIVASTASIIVAHSEIEWYNCSTTYTRYGWCAGKKYNYQERTLTSFGFRSNDRWSINTDEYVDLSGPLFDSTDRIMEEAYILYLNS